MFSAREADRLTDATLLNLENSRVRGLALNLPQVAAGQPLPCVTVSGLPASITGFWGLFEIRLQAGMHQKTQFLRIPMVRRGYVSVFLSEEGKLFLPTARHIWDALQTAEPQVQDTLGQDESITAYERLQDAAEQAGQELFDALQQAHIASVAREEERGMVAFASRRKAIERVGLPEVRQYRLARCDAEEAEWRHELQSARQIVPEIRSLLHAAHHQGRRSMSSWRDAILNDFVPNVSKLTLVADPDCLLTEEKLALELRGRGFDLIEFNDPVEFRYAYESKYRSIWDRGEHTDLVVILRLQDAELESLPYDLLQAGRKLSFNLGDLFPTLSYPVIEKLDRSLLDALFEAQRKSPPDRMGDNATKDFILRHVFGIAAELIANEVELLRALLRLHYGKLQIPLMLAERLIQVLKGHDGFKTWPLSEIVPDDEAFFAFLQERWPVFLSRLGSANQVREDSPEYGLKYPGPDHLPFDHQDIKVYIDNLFLEGKLTPVEATDIEVDAGSWVRSGIAMAGVDDEELRISRLFDLVEKELPTAESRYSDWTAFALKWAELSSLVHCGNSSEHQTRLMEIGDALNATFAGWLADHYASLINLPPTNPAMLHHVPRRLARDVEGFR